MESKKLPQTQQLDTVSPATRLLEKRRLMYENQEKYISKKKDFQQAEIGFRLQEKELREKDQEIQEALINFAAYLDANQKAIKKCEESIDKLDKENREKDDEIRRKRKQLDILR